MVDIATDPFTAARPEAIAIDHRVYFLTFLIAAMALFPPSI
jgi:hypothetical protein